MLLQPRPIFTNDHLLGFEKVTPKFPHALDAILARVSKIRNSLLEVEKLQGQQIFGGGLYWGPPIWESDHIVSVYIPYNPDPKP